MLISGSATVENSMKFPEKVKNRAAIWSCNSTSRYLSKGSENNNSERYLHLHVHCRILTTVKTWKQPRCLSIDELIFKKCDMYIQCNLFSNWKAGYLLISHNMDGSWGHYANWSKWDRERQIVYDLTYTWTILKKKKEEEEEENQTQMVSEIAAGGQKVQTSNYKINKFWICSVQHRDYH